MNPILAAMSRGTNNLAMVTNVKQMLNGQNPDAFAEMLAKKNPQFAQFRRECEGKTIDQIAEQYGLNADDLKSVMK
jgi:hypothetical protein